MSCSPSTDRLSAEQRSQFTTEGYFVVRGVLTPQEVDYLGHAVDGLFERHATPREEVSGTGATEDRSGVVANAVEKCDALLMLLDHPRTFPLVLDLLGPYITLGLSETTVKAPAQQTGDHTGFIHTDGGHSLSRISIDENSRPLLVKTHYFLTDCCAPRMGNFAVVPRSHSQTPFWKPGSDTTPDKAKAIPVLMKAGDCVMWAHPLWHGAMPNLSPVTRKTVTLGYTQMFIRPLAEPPSQRLLSRCTLRQRRLLGDMGDSGADATWGSQFGYFYPTSDYADIMQASSDPAHGPA